VSCFSFSPVRIWLFGGPVIDSGLAACGSHWLLNLCLYSDFEHVLEKNDRLTNATQEYEAATIVHTTFTNEGYGELYSFNSRSADLLIYLPLQLILPGFCK